MRLCTPIRQTPEEQRPLAVDAGLIAVLRRSGTVEVVTADGRHVAAARFGRGVAQAAALDGTTLVVQRAGALDVFDLPTNTKTATWPLVAASARLAGLDGGLAVYLAGGRAHVLRVADGKAVAVAAARDAALEGAGLFYATGRRVVFVPRALVVRRLGS